MKRMNRVFSLLVIVSLLVGMIPAPSWAALENRRASFSDVKSADTDGKL